MHVSRRRARSSALMRIGRMSPRDGVVCSAVVRGLVNA